jgi:1,4-dihydroxy-2-naphthoyl-CoA hydrolase
MDRMSTVGTGSFEHFDPRIAEALIKANESVKGLPGYLGVHIVELTAGRLIATMPVREELLTPLGSLHGGVMAGLVDHVLGCVMYPLMKRGQWAATTEFKLNYMSAVKSGTLSAESTVLSLTRRTAVVQVLVENDGRPVCAAQGTVLVVDPAQR